MRPIWFEPCEPAFLRDVLEIGDVREGFNEAGAGSLAADSAARVSHDGTLKTSQSQDSFHGNVNVTPPSVNLSFMDQMTLIPPMEQRDAQQSRCPKCGQRNRPVRSILDTRTGRTHHMYECRCGNQSWSSDAVNDTVTPPLQPFGP